MQERLDAVQAENARLQQQIPPIRRAEPQQEPDPAAEEERFNNEFFTNPAQALRKALTAQNAHLETRYKSEMNREKFWGQFYGKNEDLDLPEVRPLVDMMLNTNWDVIGPLPASKAMERLAALTRERLASYASIRGRAGKKVTVEGASTTQTPRQVRPQQSQRPSGISGLIKARNAARRNGGKAA
jgi:hypothetical protein